MIFAHIKYYLYLCMQFAKKYIFINFIFNYNNETKQNFCSIYAGDGSCICSL